MNMTPAIFSGERILSSHGVIGGRGVFAGPAHPLAGYSAPLMLHRGDNVPVGVYQDRACTVPATADMDPIRGWKDEILHTPLAAVAPTDANRAFLRIIGGTPCVYFDGVDSRLEITGYPTGSWDSTHLLSARMVLFGTNQYLATNQHANDRDSFIGGFGNDHVRYWNGSSAVTGCGLLDTADFRVYAGVREDTGSSAIYRGYRDGTPGETAEVANRYQSGPEWILGAGEDGVTPAEMYVSSWCLRAAKSSEEEIVAASAFLKSLAPGNPLAGIPSLLDLRTHAGDKIPLGIHPGEDDRNIWWGGFTGAGVQPVETQQPLTKFTTDGTPYLDFDGVDDWMSVGTHGGKVTYTILVRSKTPSWNMWASFLESSGEVDNPNRWGSLLPGSNSFQSGNLPESVRCEGISLSAPFPIPVPSAWNIITVTTSVSPGTVDRGLFQWESRFFLAAEIIALFIHDGVPDSGRIEAVENYFTTLKP